MMLYHSLRYCHQCKIDDDGRDEAGDGIDQIMRLNIYGSQTQEDVELAASRIAFFLLPACQTRSMQMVLTPTCELGKAAVGRARPAFLASSTSW